ncbi:MAG: zinc ABC transporter substrate-binding protein [Candidatus Sumerlaeia bacterium]|nr:zinc ABC transporter substrate-binding protein [Candidatus Sumerlaeia bacterium]
MLRPLFTLLALFAWTVGCQAPAAEPRADSAPYRVVATTGMVADLVRHVAGDKADVVQLVGDGVDPHLYTPTRNDVAHLHRAQVVFYSGLLLEGRMTDMLVRLARTRPVFAVTEAIDESALLGAEGGHPDPHVWMEVRLWSQGLDAVAESLAAFDPNNADLYRANAAAYRTRLAELDDYARRVLDSIPADRRVMITAHDAFGYMGRAYGLEVLGIQGISTESEAGLQDINRLVDLLVARRVPAIFVESSVSDKNVRALIEGAAARGHKVRIGGELFSDAMGPSGMYEGTYMGMIDHNVTTIARALGGEAPERGMQGRLAAPAAVGADR